MRATLTEHNLDRVGLFTELSEGRPVVLLVHVTDEFHYADPTTGRIKSPEPSTAGQGLHAVLCMGFAEDEDAKVHFLIRNSWGEGWGAQGYAWLPDDYIDNFCLQMGFLSNPLSFP
ncbi:C1 family peptidase [Arthrobacter sp. Z4-13]